MTYQFDTVVVDVRAMRVTRAGTALDLEPKAFDVLAYLVKHPGRLIEKQELLDVVWKGVAVTDNALTRVVAQVRRAIGDDAREAAYIETVPTRGYRFIAPVSITSPHSPDVAVQPLVNAAVPVRPPVQATDSVQGGPPDLVSKAPALPVAASAGPEPRERSARNPVPLALVGAAIAVAMAGLWLYRPAARAGNDPTTGGAPPRPFARPVQATTAIGLDAYPEFSADGKSLAYSTDAEGSYEIVIHRLDAGVPDRKVTSDGQVNVQAAWSPDGRRLAYHSMRRGGIWMIPSDGGTPRQLTTFGSRPAWSPDGRRIAFQSQRLQDLSPGTGAAGESTIWTVEPETGRTQPVTQARQPLGPHATPRWSPDGRHIVFALGFDEYSIWLVDAGGTAPPRSLLTRGTAPLISPDGRWLLYVAQLSAIERVQIDIDSATLTGEPEPLVPAGAQQVTGLSMAANGQRLAFVAVGTKSRLVRLDLDADERPAAPPRDVIADASLRMRTPAISPDGTRVAFVRARGGSPRTLCVADLETGQVQQFTALAGTIGFPSWSPDGRSVLAVAEGDANSAVWSIDVATQAARKLLEGPSSQSFAAARVSSNGRELACAITTSGVSNVWTVPLDGGPRRQLTLDAVYAGFPTWSPDGRFLAYNVRRDTDSQIFVISRDGGQPTQVTDIPGQSYAHSWSPDGRRIAFAGQREGVWNIWWVTWPGGETRQLTDYSRLSAFVRYPAWSPRGNFLVYELVAYEGNVWTLDLANRGRDATD